MLEDLRKAVLEANQELVRQGLVLYTWGNVSGIDREKGLVVIKPSGVRYEDLAADSLVVVDLDGRTVEGHLRPSSDTSTHIELYKAFPFIGGVVHTHSTQAVAWAQAGRDIPALGTTHADYFHGPVPCTGNLAPEEIAGDYEAATGRLIARTFRHLDPMETPAVLVKSHGPFCWGRDAAEAVYNARVLEEVALMARLTLDLNPDAVFQKELEDKHFSRKHGPGAYYGQVKGGKE
ncbi:MAG: L-ribulose-5-phosphate 4-epimerase [Bacteroidales bacterium]|nr:L-ribulose-5-phosphate 4-epimerase [Bacteroidales bacterium]